MNYSMHTNMNKNMGDLEMNKDMQRRYDKLNQFVQDTDASIVVMANKNDKGYAISSMVHVPDDVNLILEMFRCSYLACKEALEKQDDERVNILGAEFMLQTIMEIKPPEDMTVVTETRRVKD